MALLRRSHVVFVLGGCQGTGEARCHELQCIEFLGGLSCRREVNVCYVAVHNVLYCKQFLKGIAILAELLCSSQCCLHCMYRVEGRVYYNDLSDARQDANYVQV
jgi:hypothetical protein